ncbi:MAG TPA: hypothetical protein PLO68_13285, partial [Sedimentisphaerales bacterium]|nr:hypothetical protein [Sedimentisphaerales bacterium]
MRTRYTSLLPATLLVVAVSMLFRVALAQPEPGASSSGVNMAAVAEPSSSYVSGDTSNVALNDEYDPRSSRDNRRGSYGNWPTRGTQWVQYEWSRPINTNKIDVYWWDDRRGVRLPKACRLLYWKDGAFATVSSPAGLSVEGDRYNTTTFDEVVTSKLR